ncbi:AAA domain-containing protein [Mumia flava]|uniref:AAA domain-containing protein n=1 Tax=Mumia flava TaxID=1348852 RepID=A0A0B2BSV3_9ACTN|nr:AAA family ATPase [Mumia flava]PJJ53761.1 AAA domain-containing protein [Mumia flava]
MTIEFTPPAVAYDAAQSRHHRSAAAENVAAVDEAISIAKAAVGGSDTYDKVLLRAAAGAGKSYALRRMVGELLDEPDCQRIAVAAFTNKQVFALAGALGTELGADAVCLFVSRDRYAGVPAEVRSEVSVASSTPEIPADAQVVLGTSHKLGAIRERSRLLENLGAAREDPEADESYPFDVLMVDEAWQLPLYLFNRIEKLAPIAVGVGDVGQLPPLDPNQNPWRGDPGYNPYRAWPTAYEGASTTFSIDLPAVWRPTHAQIPLWRAFYGDWDRLDCVAGPGDRTIERRDLGGDEELVWDSVASGVPTLVEVAGLEDSEAPDIDPPLMGVAEQLIESLIEGGFAVHSTTYDGEGEPAGSARASSDSPSGDPLIVVLATRNQAVDDAQEVVDRLTSKHDLPDGVLVASTVDSWQGQTNAITVALHPLSGASRLDEFNSAFGRLAVTCTRATHGLLLLARDGLDELLDAAPARPGTPFGEPGTRELPRQTHQRILRTFARGVWEMENHD